MKKLVVSLAVLLAIYALIITMTHAKHKSEAAKHFLEGGHLYEQGKYEEAIVALDKAVELDPKFAMAYINRGYVLIFLARYDDAIKSLQVPLKLRPDYRDALLNMALALQKRNGPGDAEKAKGILQKLIKENDTDNVAAGAYALLGDRANMLSLVRTLVAEKPHLKQIFRTDLEFENYRDDPEFQAIAGG